MAEVIDEHIDGLLKATSRSFHLTLTTLPNSVRDQVGLLYLLARLADTIADSKTEDAEALMCVAALGTTSSTRSEVNWARKIKQEQDTGGDNYNV